MANGSPNITSVIKSLGSGKKATANNLINEIGLQNAAVIAKLRKPTASQEVAKNDRESANVINHAELKQIADFVGKRKRDSENITKLFPDVELAKQIYISSTIAPKDMTSTEILYEADDALFPADLVVKANECIKKHIEGHYEINTELQEILRESLFESGAYVVATLPESSVDEIINGDKSYSLESASPIYNQDREIKSLGYLSDDNDAGLLALESFMNGDVKLPGLKSKDIAIEGVNLGIELYDNFEMLKLPRLASSITKELSKQIIKKNSSIKRPSVATEHSYNTSGVITSAGSITGNDIRASIFKEATNSFSPVVSVKTKELAARKSIGRALRMKIPAEAVIPVYPPGQPENHAGYIFLLDINGAPITVDTDRGYMDGITGLMSNNVSQNQSTGLQSYLLKKAKDTLVGNENIPTLRDMSRVYSSIIEKEIINKFKNGLYKKELAIGDNDNIYRMMMFRALAGHSTKMLYVPAELVTYYAYRYHRNGVGKSMLDDLTMLISSRAVIMVARILQQIRSSINSTNVTVTLPEGEQDPEKVMELTVANVMKYLQFQMPVGLVTQADLYEWVARAGVRFTFEGHPGLPELKYDFANDTIGNTIPDTELDEDLRRRTYMAFGLSPEQVDNSLSPDFATSVLANNALLAKRVMNTQEIYCRHMTEDARKIMRYDAIAYAELRDIVKANIALIKKQIKDTDNIASESSDDEDLITELTERYIDSFKLGLPKPDQTTVDNQMEALEKAEAFIDKLLESHVSSEAFPEMVSGNANSKIDEYKGIVKAALMRQWISNNPSYKDVNDIISRTMDKDGKTTIFDITKIHVQGFITSMLKFAKDSKPFANAASADVEKIDNNSSLQPEEETNPETDNESTTPEANPGQTPEESGTDQNDVDY